MNWSVVGRHADGTEERFDIDLPYGWAYVGGTWPASQHPGKQWRFTSLSPESTTIEAELVEFEVAPSAGSMR